MRTIKFRGKDFAGTWWYGYPSLYEGNPVIHPLQCIGASMHVDEDSVGQFTGLTDADGKEIYEGDLLLSDENAEVFEVVYDAPRFCFKDNDFGFRFLNHPEFFHVIGNIHDNKSLIEEGGNK